MSGHTLEFPVSPAVEKPLSPKQQQAVAHRASGKTWKQTAALVHVDAKTLWTWRKLPAFDRALRDARDEAFAESLADLKALTGEANAAARALLKSGKGPVRVRAVAVVLSNALRANEQLAIEERLAVLERRAGIR